MCGKGPGPGPGPEDRKATERGKGVWRPIQSDSGFEHIQYGRMVEDIEDKSVSPKGSSSGLNSIIPGFGERVRRPWVGLSVPG